MKFRSPLLLRAFDSTGCRSDIAEDQRILIRSKYGCVQSTVQMILPALAFDSIRL